MQHRLKSQLAGVACWEGKEKKKQYNCGYPSCLLWQHDCYCQKAAWMLNQKERMHMLHTKVYLSSLTSSRTPIKIGVRRFAMPFACAKGMTCLSQEHNTDWARMHANTAMASQVINCVHAASCRLLALCASLTSKKVRHSKAWHCIAANQLTHSKVHIATGH